MMEKARLKVGILVAIVWSAVGAQPLGAQQDVKILRGSFVFATGHGQLDISGTQGFSFQAGASISGGFFEGYSQCEVPECAPGTVVNLNAGWSGNDLGGDARYRGTAYDAVGSLSADSSAGVLFSGTVTMPEMSEEPVSVAVPFQLSGSFAYGLNGAAPERVGLSGGGTATLYLRPAYEGTSWIIERAVFDFAPDRRAR
jgi:hypothetical protein